MSAMASQITGVSMVCSTACSGAGQRKHQSSTSLVFVRGIHRSPVNSPHKGPVTRKCFQLMTSSWLIYIVIITFCASLELTSMFTAVAGIYQFHSRRLGMIPDATVIGTSCRKFTVLFSILWWKWHMVYKSEAWYRNMCRYIMSLMFISTNHLTAQIVSGMGCFLSVLPCSGKRILMH